ncbi:hypothetical protein GYH30_041549 [Glycine max]|nr:hypothetical protein GYH30_041549 [Glycine max]
MYVHVIFFSNMCMFVCIFYQRVKSAHYKFMPSEAQELV